MKDTVDDIELLMLTSCLHHTFFHQVVEKADNITITASVHGLGDVIRTDIHAIHADLSVIPQRSSSAKDLSVEGLDQSVDGQAVTTTATTDDDGIGGSDS